MKKRIVSVLTSMALSMCMFPSGMTAIAEDTAAPFEGAGTAANPYQISTAYDLRLFSELINDADTNSEYRSCYYIQTADIDLNDEPFTPIAAQVDADTRYNFDGYYNGNYKSVEGLYVESDYAYVGMFGRLTGGAVENLSVEGTITAPKVGHCGGIIGEIANNATVKNCSYNGKIDGSYSVGGIVGYIWVNGIIENCYFNGSLSASNETGGCGGILGAANNGNESNLSVAGNVTIQNCYATGSMSAASSEYDGGIVGKIRIYGENSTYSISNNFYLYTMADTGINGDVTTGTMKMAETAIKACADMLGSPFVDNCEADNFNDGYPIFEWQSTPYQFKGSGTAEDPYQISSKDELKKMRDLVNSNYFGGQYNHLYYVQTADIDLENEIWEPIGTRMKNGVDQSKPLFNGNYNGQYHKIINLNVNKTGGDRYAGLFGSFHSSDGKYIENLIVYGNVTGDSGGVGGIAGEVVNGGATIRNCAFIGNVNGTSAVGGIVGVVFQNGKIENCYHVGNVTGSKDDIGGIVGQILVGDHVKGTVNLKNCYHVGSVTGNTGRTGEIVGCMFDNEKVFGEIHVSNCYYVKKDGTVGYNGTFDSCDMTGVSASLLKKTAEELGSPFVTSPSDTLNDGYPVFAWQLDTWGKGDINLDGQVSVADAVYLQGYLLCRFSFNETEWHAADLIDDDNVDAFDMVIMRRILLAQ